MGSLRRNWVTCYLFVISFTLFNKTHINLVTGKFFSYFNDSYFSNVAFVHFLICFAKIVTLISIQILPLKSFFASKTGKVKKTTMENYISLESDNIDLEHGI
jgi:hypothetical protein